MAGSPGRAVQLPLIALALGGLAGLPLLAHARNRLLSGQPVGIGGVLGQADLPLVAALLVAAVLVLLPLLRPSPASLWAGLLGVGLALATVAVLAAGYARTADATGPAARTSFAAGFWVFAGALLLLASDLARRLPHRWLAAILVAVPLAACVASGVLAPLSLLREYAAQHELFRAALIRHVVLVVGALLPALLIGVPLGIAAQRQQAVRRVAFPVLNLVQTIPSIALFGLLIGPLSWLGHFVPGVSGIGLVPALLALVLYSLLPIVRNTVEGLDGVPRSVPHRGQRHGHEPRPRPFSRSTPRWACRCCYPACASRRCRQ